MLMPLTLLRLLINPFVLMILLLAGITLSAVRGRERSFFQSFSLGLLLALADIFLFWTWQAQPGQSVSWTGIPVFGFYNVCSGLLRLASFLFLLRGCYEWYRTPAVETTAGELRKGPDYANPLLPLGLIMVGNVLMLVMTAFIRRSQGLGESLLMIAGAISLLVGIVVYLVYLYRAWGLLQDGTPRTKPGQAVGYLFIPVFNLFWSFQCLWGWAVDYNSYVRERNLTAPAMPEKLFFMTSVMTLLSLFLSSVSFLGPLVVTVNMVLNVLTVTHLCSGMNALQGSRD